MSQKIDQLRDIIARLRAPDGCPWDREQTHLTLRESLIEECYETIDAISRSDDKNLREELGDLLLHVVMHAQIASERGVFNLDEVIVEVCEKLIRRHPHVFADKNTLNSNEVLSQWDEIKRKEKGNSQGAILAGVPEAFPALMQAQKVQKKASRAGFDWSEAAPVLDKIREEIEEVSEAIKAKDVSSIYEEVGDILFSVVNLARKLGIDSELALKESTKKFIHRFEKLEKEIKQRDQNIKDMTLSELDAIWDIVKKTG